MDERALAALAASVDLPIPESRLGGVEAALGATLAMATRVMAAPLPKATIESAPVFDAWAAPAE